MIRNNTEKNTRSYSKSEMSQFFIIFPNECHQANINSVWPY